MKEEKNVDVTKGCVGKFYIKNKKKEELCAHRLDCFFYKMKKANGLPLTYDNPFRFVADFRACTEYKKTAGIESEMLTDIIYGVLYINDLACASIVDLRDLVKDKDKETKKIFGALEKRRKNYEREIFEIVSDKISFLAQFNDFMDEKVQIHFKKLRVALNFVLSKHGVQDKVFLSKIIASNMIIESSVEFIKKSLSTCCKYGINAVNLKHYSLDEMAAVSKGLTDWCLRKVHGIDLNNESEVVSSYQELIRILSDWNVIKDAINKTIEHDNRE